MAMKFYLEQSVFEAALVRIRWLFDEFENIIVDTSGGKDSTVVVNLCLQVAEEKGRLPLKVMFVDQEAEWQTVIDHVRWVMSDPRIEPLWLQCPFKLFNATSGDQPWLFCWEEGADWIRPKEPNSIVVNSFGTDRFKKLFGAYLYTVYPEQPAIHIAGVRTEESPARMKGLTSNETYKGETWGKIEYRPWNQYTFYPVYDWSYTDVWKAIHDNNWKYCPLYDYQYQYGVATMDMRVSNVHHETAIKTLYYLQEIEADTWNRITARVRGINTAGQMQKRFMAPRKLPPMFKDWHEYRDHLIENIPPDEKTKQIFRRMFAGFDERFEDPVAIKKLVMIQIASVLTNDYEGTKLSTFNASNALYAKNAGTRGGFLPGRGQFMDKEPADAPT